MRRGLSGKMVAIMALPLLVAILAYVWIDGGREPVREIRIPVAVPEGAR